MVSTLTNTSEAMHSILVIDSGVGGLSVCQSILLHDPRIHITYFADDAFFPYGLMTEDALIERLTRIVDVMLARSMPDLVVLACNTASTLLLPTLRDAYSLPFVGVVPAIKPAAALTKTQRIGLIATPATVKRPYIDALIDQFANECEVVRVGSNALVLQAEKYLKGEALCEETLLEAMRAFNEEKERGVVDVVVLGCTHFPLIRSALKKLLPDVAFIDSGEAIARRVVSLLSEQPLGRSDESVRLHEIHFSGQMPETDTMRHALSRLGFCGVNFYLSEITSV